MLRLRTRLRRTSRLSPGLEALEDRALAALGQISLAFSPPVGGAGVPAVTGTLPDRSIDVLTYSVASLNPATIGGATGGAGAGRVTFDPLIVTAAAGPQSAPLFQAEASGAHFQSVVLSVRNSAAQMVTRYDFGTVFVSNIASSFATDDATPTETYQFQYGSVRITTFNPITTAITNVATWNQITNSPTVSTLGFAPTRVDATPGATDVATADAGAAATKVTLRSQRHAGPGGATIGYTARVTSAAGVPTGAVTFYAGATRLGSAPVGLDGTATLTVPAAVVGRARAYAIYSGGPDSAFLPGSSVTNGAQVRRLFLDSMGRPMTADEWALTSIWINQGLSTQQMGSIYRSLAKRLR
jgi:type VI secretion system secreted protein Hcp